MRIDPTYETIKLPDKSLISATRIVRADDAPELISPPHFHVECELVWFKDAAGRCAGESLDVAIGPRVATFIPSLLLHEFRLQPGPGEWILVQFDPSILSDFCRHEWVSSPDRCSAQRVELLLDWLVERATDGADPQIASKLLSLVLSVLGEARQGGDKRPSERSTRIDRIRPAIEWIHAAPGAKVSLQEAATRCHVSPAYFSRRFSELIGKSFRDYRRELRLNLAARRLASTTDPVSRIGYDLGFSSPAHFASLFRRRFGVAPRQFRRAPAGGRLKGQE